MDLWVLFVLVYFLQIPMSILFWSAEIYDKSFEIHPPSHLILHQTRERERERSETRFLMGSELLHKRRDFVNAFMGWRRDSAWAVSTEELTMEKKD